MHGDKGHQGCRKLEGEEVSMAENVWDDLEDGGQRAQEALEGGFHLEKLYEGGMFF
jgi:hypothetical protein